MAIQKTDAIVLRNQDLRETSSIVTFFTRDFGKIKGIIKGIRGPRPQQISNPQLFSLNEIVFYEKRRSDFSIVSHCDLKDFFYSVREDLKKIAYASYFVNLLDALTPLFDKNEAFFDILLNSLVFLTQPASPRRVARIFEIKLLDAMGLAPSLEGCSGCGSGSLDEFRFSAKQGGVLCKNCYGSDMNAKSISKGTVNFIEHVRKTPYPLVERLKVSDEVGKEVEDLLREFIDMQVGRRLKTVDFLQEVCAL